VTTVATCAGGRLSWRKSDGVGKVMVCGVAKRFGEIELILEREIEINDFSGHDCILPDFCYAKIIMGVDRSQI
jgi:hypothetical protein